MGANRTHSSIDLFHFFSESFRACLLATSAYRTHKQEVSPMKILPAPTFSALWPLELALLSGCNCSLYGYRLSGLFKNLKFIHMKLIANACDTFLAFAWFRNLNYLP